MITKSTEAGEWLKIPGFSRYRIHRDTREIQYQLKNTGEWRTRKISSSSGCLRLTSDKGGNISGRPNRFYYCAIHNINPMRLDSNLYVVDTPDKGLQLFDSRNFSEYKIKNKPERSDEYIKGEYRKAQRFINMVLEAYDTNDYTAVVTEIWSYETRMIEFLKTRSMAFNKKKIQEIWMEVFDTIIDAIKNRKAYIVNVFGYLKRIAVTIVANERKINARIKSLETMIAPPPVSAI